VSNLYGYNSFRRTDVPSHMCEILRFCEFFLPCPSLLARLWYFLGIHPGQINGSNDAFSCNDATILPTRKFWGSKIRQKPQKVGVVSHATEVMTTHGINHKTV